MLDKPVIIIGSGPAGAQAADELVSRGIPVLMIDGGETMEMSSDEPEENFEDVRRSRSDQAFWFLGKDLSGIPVSGLTGGLGGGQVSGNRAYTVRHADQFLPLHTENCQVIQSLAKGGLGAAWGAACAIPEATELRAMGLNQETLEPHLLRTIQSVGISGPQVRNEIQPPLPLDLHGTLVKRRYEKHHGWFAKKRLSVSQPLSAILTKDLGDRRASMQTDMEYWTDPHQSVYRPQYTINALQKKDNFQYEGGFVVTSFRVKKEGVTVHAKRIENGEECVFHGSKMMLAAGAIGSARIALQSTPEYVDPLPFVAKPHVFTACLHLATLGKTGPKKRNSLCQLLLLDEEIRHGMRSGLAQLYSYRSLMLFRLLSSQPFPCPEALRMLALLTPALVIADIRFPAFPEHGTLSTKNGTLHASCSVPTEEKSLRLQSWKRLQQGLRKLGLLPVKNMELPEASTSHYAGTLPYQEHGGMLTTTKEGALRGHDHVFVADAAVFKALPVLPHTLSIMANARRIAAHLAETI